jgi:hypothetical protein
MKNLTLSQKIVGIITALLALFGAGDVTGVTDSLFGGAAGNRPETAFSWSSTATSGVVAMTAGQSKLILATSSKRAYAYFNAPSCAVPVYLRFADSNGTTLTLPNTGGIVLNATNTTYEIKQENLYRAAVYASSSAACIVNVTEAQF